MDEPRRPVIRIRSCLTFANTMDVCFSINKVEGLNPMLRKRIEKLEAGLPEPAGKLREHIERQSLNALCLRDRELVSEVFGTNGQRKVWSPAHATAIERYRESSELSWRTSVRGT
jgi:hypothetical protein